MPDLCKYLTYCFAKNEILRDIYLFDTQVYPLTLDELLNNGFNGGGTCIDNVTKYIQKQGDNPSIILTDKHNCPFIVRK